MREIHDVLEVHILRTRPINDPRIEYVANAALNPYSSRKPSENISRTVLNSREIGAWINYRGNHVELVSHDRPRPDHVSLLLADPELIPKIKSWLDTL